MTKADADHYRAIAVANTTAVEAFKPIEEMQAITQYPGSITQLHIQLNNGAIRHPVKVGARHVEVRRRQDRQALLLRLHVLWAEQPVLLRLDR